MNASTPTTGASATSAGAGSPPQPGTAPTANPLFAQLAPMLPMLLAQAQQGLATATDAQLEHIAAQIASIDAWKVRRLAFFVLAATVREIGGFRPDALRVHAKLPANALGMVPHRDGWLTVDPVPRERP